MPFCPLVVCALGFAASHCTKSRMVVRRFRARCSELVTSRTQSWMSAGGLCASFRGLYWRATPPIAADALHAGRSLPAAGPFALLPSV